MAKSKIFLVSALLIITAILAFFYLRTRAATPKGSLAIVCEDKKTLTDPFSSGTVGIKGTVLNNKGQEKEISENGALLSSVLDNAGFHSGSYSAAKVVSSDEFAADVTADEIAESAKVYLAERKEKDGTTTARLIVFGDKDSKRQVKNVVRIELSK